MVLRGRDGAKPSNRGARVERINWPAKTFQDGINQLKNLCNFGWSLSGHRKVHAASSFAFTQLAQAE
jgi:hypothetical protein